MRRRRLKFKSHQERASRSCTRRNQLRLEPLEARRLLAGIQVSVYIDQDASRSFEESNDQAAADRLIYIDLDGNGEHDAGEPVAVTDSEGKAFFEDLEPGDYSLGILTNPLSQKQSTNVGVSRSASPASDISATNIVTNAHGDVWLIDSEGLASRLDDPSEQIDLGGEVQTAVDLVNSDSTFLVVSGSGGEENSLVRFHPASGEVQAIELPEVVDGKVLESVSESKDGLIGILASESERAVVRIGVLNDYATFSPNLGLGAQQVSASPADSQFALLDTREGISRVTLLSPTGDALDSVEFEEPISSIQRSADGLLLFAVLEEGGIEVFNTVDGQLTEEAILAEAAAPITARSSDGRVITGSTQNQKRFTVWDPETWLPVGSTELESDTATILGMTTDAFGDQAYAITNEGVFASDLAEPQQIVASVLADETHIELGVRIVGNNQAPSVDDFEERKVAEDNADILDFSSENGIVDSDGDRLWFTLQTGPENGELDYDPIEGWEYHPAYNFHGEDSAVFLVHDGVESSELVVRWDIAAVNDPPVAVRIQIPALPENPEPGTSIGFFSVEDPDLDAEYKVTTSDPRFRIAGGQIFYTDGELDFDAEPNIAFQVVATDVENEYAISAGTTLELTNVNEPPLQIDLNSYEIQENLDGEAVGQLTVLDPDSESAYQFELSDERFELVGNELRLRDGVELDHESEPEIRVTVTAEDQADDGHSISEELTLTVVDSNDAPTGIEVAANRLYAEEPGALVGSVSVIDQDNEAYDFELSDARFEVVGSFLKLKDDQYIPDAASELDLAITATSRRGDRIAGTIPLIILPPRPQHQNPANPRDVNGDGRVTPLDALELINDINQGRGGPLPHLPPGERPTGEGPDGEPVAPFPDVNGDETLSPLDVLEVINELNRSAAEGEYVYATDYGPQLPSDIQAKRKELRDSEIESELEQLLDQLSRGRHSRKA